VLISENTLKLVSGITATPHSTPLLGQHKLAGMGKRFLGQALGGRKL